jgi:hypothetical protein
MARKIRLTPYGEPTVYGEHNVEAFDEDAGGSEYMSYRSTPSSASNGDSLPDDPIPLFLYNQIEEPQAPRFGRTWNKSGTSRRALKTGILAASAAAIVLLILSVENPLALFANAKASLIGNSTAQPSASHSVPTIQAAVDVRTVPTTVREAPTRDEIAAAFKMAHQSQPETRPQSQPEVRQQSQPEIRQPSAAAPPVRRLSADELAVLLKRARSLIAIGDIAPARLLLERAADAQEASAALLLAQTYDPAVLGTPDMRSVTPDPAMARSWYQKAARFGSLDAQQRLAQMQN